MPEISIEGYEEVERLLKYLKPERIAKANEVILNKTATVMKSKINAGTSIFDRPTAYTKNSTYIEPAIAPIKLTAAVKLKDDPTAGTPATKYLWPQVYGGKRELKPYEKRLNREGILPDGMITVPGPQAKLNKYGNIPASEIVLMLSQLRTFNEGGYSANLPRNIEGQYFWISNYDKTKLGGIYKRENGIPKRFLTFARKQNYKPLFHFHEIGIKEANEKMIGIAEEIVDKVLTWQLEF